MRSKLVGIKRELTPEDAEWWVNGASRCSLPLVCESCGEITTAVYVLAAHAKLEADIAEGQFTCGVCEERGVLRRTGERRLIITPTREETEQIVIATR